MNDNGVMTYVTERGIIADTDEVVRRINECTGKYPGFSESEAIQGQVGNVLRILGKGELEERTVKYTPTNLWFLGNVFGNIANNYDQNKRETDYQYTHAKRINEIKENLHTWVSKTEKQVGIRIPLDEFPDFCENVGVLSDLYGLDIPESYRTV